MRATIHWWVHNERSRQMQSRDPQDGGTQRNNPQEKHTKMRQVNFSRTQEIQHQSYLVNYPKRGLENLGCKMHTYILHKTIPKTCLNIHLIIPMFPF